MAGATRGSSTARFSPMTSSSLECRPSPVRSANRRKRDRYGLGPEMASVVARSEHLCEYGIFTASPLCSCVLFLVSPAAHAQQECAPAVAAAPVAAAQSDGEPAATLSTPTAGTAASRTGAAAGPATVYCDHLTKLSSTRGTHRNEGRWAATRGTISKRFRHANPRG